MQKFRKITVDDIDYKWLFRYDDYDYINYPYLLIVMNSCPKATLQITFAIKEHFQLNSGLLTSYQGNKVIINLNQPLYISQIIQQCRKDGVQFEKNGYQYLNGVKILKEIGYEINPILLN